MALTTGVLLYEGMEELDFAGPYEVFSMARIDHPDDRVLTIAETADPVRAFNGLRVLPDASFDDAPPLDVLVVPGGLGSRQQAENAKLVDWIRGVAPGCTWVTSVCTGSLLLHVAGVARGRRVATHWAFVEEFSKRDDVTVVPEVRFVRDGNLVTSAGVSAGIDMSLWVVGQLHGPDHARRVQRMMQYDPAPPYTAEV